MAAEIKQAPPLPPTNVYVETREATIRLFVAHTDRLSRRQVAAAVREAMTVKANLLPQVYTAGLRRRGANAFFF